MGPARRPLAGTVFLLAAGVATVDQLTKQWALAALTEGERVEVLGDLLGLTLLFNPGAALSLATGMTWVFTLAAVAVIGVVVRVSARLGSWAWSVALGLLLGGALGNLVDRLFRPPGFARGHVVDFIAYGDLFVGNVADIAIVVAAGLIVVQSLRGIGLDGRRASPDDAAPAAEDGTASDDAPAADVDAAGDRSTADVHREGAAVRRPPVPDDTPDRAPGHRP